MQNPWKKVVLSRQYPGTPKPSHASTKNKLIRDSVRDSDFFLLRQFRVYRT